MSCHLISNMREWKWHVSVCVCVCAMEMACVCVDIITIHHQRFYYGICFVL